MRGFGADVVGFRTGEGLTAALALVAAEVVDTPFGEVGLSFTPRTGLFEVRAVA